MGLNIGTLKDVFDALLNGDSLNKLSLFPGLTGKGSNNFIDCVHQVMATFPTKQNFLNFVNCAWDNTKPYTGTDPVLDSLGSMTDLLKIVSDSANFVDGIPAIKRRFSKAQFLAICGMGWDSLQGKDLSNIADCNISCDATGNCTADCTGPGCASGNCEPPVISPTAKKPTSTCTSGTCPAAKPTNTCPSGNCPNAKKKTVNKKSNKKRRR